MCKKCGVFAVRSTCRLVGDTPGRTGPHSRHSSCSLGLSLPLPPHAPRCHPASPSRAMSGRCAGRWAFPGRGGGTRRASGLDRRALLGLHPSMPSLWPRSRGCESQSPFPGALWALKATFSDLTSSCQGQGCLVLLSSPLPGSGLAVFCAVLGPLQGLGEGWARTPSSFVLHPPTCTAGFSGCAGGLLGIVLWQLGAILWESGIAAVSA